MPVVAAYPNAIAAFTEKFDFTDVVFAAHINALQAEVAALETILGTLPQGTAATVKARIGALEDGIAILNGRFDSGGQIPQSGVTGLVTALADRSLVGHIHSESDVTNLPVDLAGLAPTVHTHSEAQVTSLSSDLASLSASISSLNTSLTSSLNAESGSRAALPKGRIALRSHGSTNNVGATTEALFTDGSGNITLTVTLDPARKYRIVYWGMGVADAQGGTTDYNQASVDVRLRRASGTGAPSNTAALLGWVRQAIGKGDSRIASSIGTILAEVSGLSGQHTFGLLGQTTVPGTSARMLNSPASSPAGGISSVLEVLDDGAA